MHRRQRLLVEMFGIVPRRPCSEFKRHDSYNALASTSVQIAPVSCFHGLLALTRDILQAQPTFSIPLKMKQPWKERPLPNLVGNGAGGHVGSDVDFTCVDGVVAVEPRIFFQDS